MATNETDSIFLIDSKEAAFVLGISSRTLANWRCKGRGPAYIRLGKKRSPVMYRVSDVQDWIVAVSYTHLDVYKRQCSCRGRFSIRLSR